MADVADGRLRADAGTGASTSSRSKNEQGPAAYGLKALIRPRRGGSMACSIGGWRTTNSSPAKYRWPISRFLGWAWRHERHKVSFDDFPHVGRWYERADGAAPPSSAAWRRNWN